MVCIIRGASSCCKLLQTGGGDGKRPLWKAADWGKSLQNGLVQRQRLVEVGGPDERDSLVVPSHDEG